MKYEKTPRQARIEEHARNAWPGRSLEVVAPDEGAIHVWGDDGHMLLHVEHPLADEVMGVLARDIGSMSINAAIDAVEMILRARMSRHGIDVVGIREGRIVVWDEDGRQAATGSSLRDVIGNLDRRARTERRRHDRSELPTDTEIAALQADAAASATVALPAAGSSTK